MGCECYYFKRDYAVLEKVPLTDDETYYEGEYLRDGIVLACKVIDRKADDDVDHFQDQSDGKSQVTKSQPALISFKNSYSLLCRNLSESSPSMSIPKI